MTAYEPTFGDRVNQGMRSLLEGTLLSSEEEAQGIRQEILLVDSLEKNQRVIRQRIQN